MPAPPHPGRGGGPRKGSPPHRCCPPRTAGTALGVEVGVQGRLTPEQKTSLTRTWLRVASGLTLGLGHPSALGPPAAEGLDGRPGMMMCQAQ